MTKNKSVKEALLEAAIDPLEEIAKELDQRQAEKLRAIIKKLKYISQQIPYEIYDAIEVNGPGPTDLSWEEEHPVDFRYRPVDLPKVSKDTKETDREEKEKSSFERR